MHSAATAGMTQNGRSNVLRKFSMCWFEAQLRTLQRVYSVPYHIPAYVKSLQKLEQDRSINRGNFCYHLSENMEDGAVQVAVSFVGKGNVCTAFTAQTALTDCAVSLCTAHCGVASQSRIGNGRGGLVKCLSLPKIDSKILL